MEPAPFLGEEDAVCNGSVSVPVCVVIQADHVALGDIVEDGRGEEGEEADDSTKNRLHCKALDAQSCLKQNVWHNQETGPTGAIGEKLHPWRRTTVRKHKLPHEWLLEHMFHTCYNQLFGVRHVSTGLMRPLMIYKIMTPAFLGINTDQQSLYKRSLLIMNAFVLFWILQLPGGRKFQDLVISASVFSLRTKALVTKVKN